ncbi:hypothetical protein RQP54_18295 [Curvibacter sp. APW13]|uniref:hypothetical protein n=1 Tax=Curvibacter sp. APW13 TaxID=3077236 RepID=UPI0028DFBB75|nr:hypothetical protein [Curvibacter sp. APW13]MDT8992830.1 hypothetical protein [Curvibacter sp. APW13]
MPIPVIRGSKSTRPTADPVKAFLQRSPNGSVNAQVDAAVVDRFKKAGLLGEALVRSMFNLLASSTPNVPACKRAKAKAYALLQSREAAT